MEVGIARVWIRAILLCTGTGTLHFRDFELCTSASTLQDKDVSKPNSSPLRVASSTTYWLVFIIYFPHFHSLRFCAQKGHGRSLQDTEEEHPDMLINRLKI